MMKFVCNLAIVLMLACCLASVVVPVLAVDSTEPVISVESVSAKVGEEIQVAVTISNNPGICAAVIAISYGDGLQLISVENTDLLSNPVHGGDLNANPYLLSWDDSLAEADTMENGTLVFLHFIVKDEAESESCNIAVSYETENIFNTALENVYFETINGQVEVSDGLSQLVVILCVLAVALAAVAVVIVKRKKSVPVAALSEGGEDK